MKTRFALLAGLTATALLSGCAYKPSGDFRYDEDNSRAYNLAQAGGLHKARDTTLEEQEYKSMLSDMTNGAGIALSLSNSAGLGLSGGASLGIGIASALLSGPGMMERDSAFAFVPSTEASSPEDATDVIRNHFYAAVEGVADDTAGIAMHYNESERDIRYSRQRNLSAIYLVDDDIGCPMPTEAHRGKDVCVFGLFTPHEAGELIETPKVVDTISAPHVYPYSAHDYANALLVTMKFSDETRAILGDEAVELERLAILRKFSERMPDWFYLYLKGGDNTPPMILVDGNPELFVTVNS